MLEKLLLLVQPDRFRMAKTFIKTQGLSADSVAELVSNAVVQGLLAATQELQPGESRAYSYIKYYLSLCLFLSLFCVCFVQEKG